MWSGASTQSPAECSSASGTHGTLVTTFKRPKAFRWKRLSSPHHAMPCNTQTTHTPRTDAVVATTPSSKACGNRHWVACRSSWPYVAYGRCQCTRARAGTRRLLPKGIGRSVMSAGKGRQVIPALNPELSLNILQQGLNGIAGPSSVQTCSPPRPCATLSLCLLAEL